MKARGLLSLLLLCLLVVGCLAMPASAIVTSEPQAGIIPQATGQFEVTIPANSSVTMENSFILNPGDIASYDCTYTPRNASIKFGYIAPNGLFYGVEGSRGSFNHSIRVGQRGTYTLAIKNNSDSAVTVTGTVNY